MLTFRIRAVNHPDAACNGREFITLDEAKAECKKIGFEFAIDIFSDAFPSPQNVGFAGSWSPLYGWRAP